jgi:hypothetical protein
MARRRKKKDLPALATRSGEPISSDKLRQAMRTAGKPGPKKKSDPKFKGISKK